MLAIVKEAAETVGGTVALAKMLDCSRQNLSKWTQVPRGRAIELEEITGIPRSRFRPDLWPTEPA